MAIIQNKSFYVYYDGIVIDEEFRDFARRILTAEEQYYILTMIRLYPYYAENHHVKSSMIHIMYDFYQMYQEEEFDMKEIHNDEYIVWNGGFSEEDCPFVMQRPDISKYRVRFEQSVNHLFDELGIVDELPF